ncbi:uncharacterized protein [Prorops nasuta]|uniref:uncharacterized protein n=1 Tax=Prorops nasuta TaxID=863751 RepID=UPI0034CE32FE
MKLTTILFICGVISLLVVFGNAYPNPKHSESGDGVFDSLKSWGKKVMKSPTGDAIRKFAHYKDGHFDLNIPHSGIEISVNVDPEKHPHLTHGMSKYWTQHE